MKSLKSLVKVLRPSEKRLLLHYYSRNTNSEEKLRLALFKLVEKGVESDSEARLKLKSNASVSAYSHLKSRLKNDILNVLLMQDTTKRLAQGNRAAELDCRKKVAQSHLLLLRGAQVEGMKVLKQALKAADKFELLAERLQINHQLREFFVGATSTNELGRLNKEISKDLKIYEALLYVEEQSFVLSSPEFAKNLRTRAKEAEYLVLIEELGNLFRKHKLARIGFWYYMAATEYHRARKNFEDVVVIGLKFLKLVEKRPSVKSKNNMAGVNQTVGGGYFELRQFESAIVHFSKAEKLFPASGFNRLVPLQYLALAEAAIANYTGSLRHVGVALSHPRVATRESLVPRWLFMKASVEFLKGEVDQSFKTINSNGYLMKQQDAWNIQYRLLEMMQLISKRDEEWLEFKLDATRKFLTRHKDLDSPRVRTAIDIFGNLLRKDLDFNLLSDKNLQGLNACLNEEKGFIWNPSSPEIVRFDYWIQSNRSD